MNLQSINQDYLPPSVQDLVDVIGLNAALIIVEKRGGIRLCVPTKTSNDHWLLKDIGLESFTKLVAVYAGDEIVVPRCVIAMRILREKEIANSTESIAELARRYGYTERGIYKLKRRILDEKSDDQQELF